MKYLYILLLVALFSCSKDKETDPNAIPISMNAEVVENKWWAISLVSRDPITSSGTVDVKWNVYNDAGAFMYEKTTTVTYDFVNSRHSIQTKSTVQGSNTMSARNEKITSISGSGGYSFSY